VKKGIINIFMVATFFWSCFILFELTIFEISPMLMAQTCSSKNTVTETLFHKLQ